MNTVMINNVNQNKNQFDQDGYFIIRNLLDYNEIQDYLDLLKKKIETIKNGQKFSPLNNKTLWNYVLNKKLNLKLRELFGEKIFFLHDLNLLNPETNPENDYSWHRDSPNRSLGKGEDWNKDNHYNVVTTITYLISSKNCNTGLNLIPKSHKLEFKHSLNNYLRYFHLKTRSKNSFLYFRRLIENNIGKTIEYEPGDCVIFKANLYHQCVKLNYKDSPPNTRRIALTSRYGGEGVHSTNYINYAYNLRQFDNYQKENFEYFKKILIQNELFKEIPEKQFKKDTFFKI